MTDQELAKKARALTDSIGRGTRCSQCDRAMTPVDRMLGPVCGTCTKEDHRRVAGGR